MSGLYLTDVNAWIYKCFYISFVGREFIPNDLGLSIGIRGNLTLTYFYQPSSPKTMSKRETPMTRWYWRQIGGTLCEEFQAVPRTSTTGQRLLDAVILPKGEHKRVHWKNISLEGKDVIVVQAKAIRLGMYLMGQTLFSAQLVRRFKPKSVRSVALCTANDEILRPLLEKYKGMEVVVVPKRFKT